MESRGAMLLQQIWRPKDFARVSPVSFASAYNLHSKLCPLCYPGITQSTMLMSGNIRDGREKAR